MDIKESCFLDSCSENEGDTKDLIKKVMTETVTSISDIKTEVEDSTCSENDEHYILGFNETIKESETETKLHIKEEYCWLKSEDSCANDGIKAETHADLYSTKPANLYKQDVSSYTSHVFPSEDLENDTRLNMNKNGPERESDRKCNSQQSVVTNISLQGLQKHELTSQSIKPYKCNICTKSFTYLSGLKTHELIHEGIKPYKCNICTKSFTQMSHLNKHTLTHQNIKPRKCNICHKTFTRSTSLKNHKLIHEGIKPHKCNICNKAFTELSNLKTHKLSHQNIKPHKCNICYKTFTQLSNLKRHKVSHHNKAIQMEHL